MPLSATGRTVRVSAGIRVGRGRATGLLRLLGRRRDAGPDGPDGLVGDDDARLVLQSFQDLNEVDELRREDRQHGADALLADGQRLADAEDGREALVEHVLKLRLE